MVTAEEIEKFIPYYLTAEQKTGLAKELKLFIQHQSSRSSSYYNNAHDFLLQGDICSQLKVYEFTDIKNNQGEISETSGIILSNTCDMSSDNKRDYEPSITFVPIIRLDHFKEMLEQHGVSKVSLEAKITALQKQEITSVFYIPHRSKLNTGWVALLDRSHSMRRDYFLNISKQKYSLSIFGFYLFLFKLSIHFCRFHEAVNREQKP